MIDIALTSLLINLIFNIWLSPYPNFSTPSPFLLIAKTGLTIDQSRFPSIYLSIYLLINVKIIYIYLYIIYSSIIVKASMTIFVDLLWAIFLKRIINLQGSCDLNNWLAQKTSTKVVYRTKKRFNKAYLRR